MTTTQQSPSTARIALREIRPNPASPRKSVDPAELRELAECVRAEGERQPILVRPLTRAERGSSRRRYEVVVGSGHFHAAAQAGLREVECYVRGQAADDAVVAGLLEGTRRCPLTPAEETELLRFLRDGRR